MIFGIGAGVLALGLVFVSALVVLLFFPNVGAEVGRMVVGSIILALGLIVLALVVIAVTHIDVKEPIRNLAVELSEDNLVDFYTLMPDTYRVTDVLVRDTDDDGKKEWVVFYRFDLADGRSPYASVVYDYDRGDPPVLFPYRLTPPDRNYLSEGEITLDLQDVISVSEPADPLVPEAGAYAGDYRRAGCRCFVYLADQVGHDDRLGQANDTICRCLCHVTQSHVPRQADDRYVRRHLLQDPDCLDTIQSRHEHIEQIQVV